ncbi:MAG: FAD-dependent monooxygenase [Archangium gephyra]|uniref:FAD-dependent monooxygenase n=1 Tax=Archangium gephyra TaxID=48 RepID=A0A2W5TWV4_9BACT|nr:MAG: FAD-dependent monooxygenase [Archangium gephyra]
MKTLEVAVVGTGTVGSASALFLARQGHRVTVYERVPEPSTLGAGIMLQPTGMAVLRTLGLEAQVVSKGDVIDKLFVQTAARRKVMELEYGQLQPGLFGVGLHRGVLFDVLYRAALAEPGVTVCNGVDVEDLHTFRDGTHAVVERGTRKKLGRHDLVVVADGARSSLRDDTAFVKSVERYPWGALWAIVPDDANRFTGRLFQVVRGTHRLIGLLPTGHGPSGGGRMVSFFFSLRSDLQHAFRTGDFAEWKQGVLAEVPEAAPVLDQLAAPQSLLFSEYHDVVMWPWNTERVVYLGDAAHAMSPQLGQGCNLALLDAWVLSEAMRTGENVTDALFTYSRNRRWHLGWYQFITRALTPFFQSDFPWLQPVRDYAFPIATRLPWVRRQMVAAMAGVSRGPWLDLLSLPGGWKP